MIARDTFETLYHQLAQAWDTHQALRRHGAALSSLSESATRLEHARMAMWDWHKCNQIGSF